MKNVIDTYNSIATDYDRTFPGVNKFIDKFSEFVSKGSKVLDAGCGNVYDTKYLIEKGFEVVSLDASRSMLSVAIKNVPGHKFHLKDIRKINYKSNSFDGIVAAFSIIHLRKKESTKVIKNFHMILKNNGLLYLALQEGQGEKTLVEPLNPKNRIFVNFYTVPEIKRLLKSSGFIVILLRKRKSKSKYEFQNNKIFTIAKKA